MKTLLTEIRMTIAEWLLARADQIAPPTKGGQRLKRYAARYRTCVRLFPYVEDP